MLRHFHIIYIKDCVSKTITYHRASYITGGGHHAANKKKYKMCLKMMHTEEKAKVEEVKVIVNVKVRTDRGFCITESL